MPMNIDFNPRPTNISRDDGIVRGLQQGMNMGLGFQQMRQMKANAALQQQRLQQEQQRAELENKMTRFKLTNEFLTKPVFKSLSKQTQKEAMTSLVNAANDLLGTNFDASEIEFSPEIGGYAKRMNDIQNANEIPLGRKRLEIGKVLTEAAESLPRERFQSLQAAAEFGLESPERKKAASVAALEGSQLVHPLVTAVVYSRGFNIPLEEALKRQEEGTIPKQAQVRDVRGMGLENVLNSILRSTGVGSLGSGAGQSTSGGVDPNAYTADLLNRAGK